MAGVRPLVFAIIVVTMVVIGLLDVIITKGENKCEMTYMFERPEYVKIPLARSITKKYPNYGLYVYGEGNMKPDGIPVLFIPGNGGSYKQVRSMGSVTFRRAIDKVKRYHFNFFAVDLHEELSALHGSLMQKQTEFVHVAIKKIFTLYKNAEVKPKTIVLLGHSMGGLIARGLFTLPTFDASLVNTIFMQATPNQYPVLVLDPEIAEYHKRTNDYWKLNGNTTLKHITLVSSGGADKDIQVRGGITPLDGIVDDDHAISSTPTHSPKVWVPPDHLCVVWCKQLVFAFARSLFDIVDEKNKMITDDVTHRMSVFRHHFLHNPGTGGVKTDWPETISLDSKIPWTVMSEDTWKWTKDKVTEVTYLVIPVIEKENADRAVIVSNIPQDSWICTCDLKPGQTECKTCKDISSTGNLIPPLYSQKKVVHIDLEDENMSAVSHIVIVVPPTDKRVEVIAEVYNEGQRHLSNSVPGLMEILMSYPESVTQGAIVLTLGTNAAFYKLKLHNLNNVLKVYAATLETKKCTNKQPGEFDGSVLKFHVPWSNEDSYEFFKYGTGGNLTMKVQFVPPEPVISPDNMDFQFGYPGQVYDHVELSIYLDPTCTYKLKLRASFTEILGQFVRFYGILMPVFCVATLLMTLVHQLRMIAKGSAVPSVLDSVWAIKPFWVVPFALIIQTVIQMKAVKPHFDKFQLPDPDIVQLDQQGITFRGMQLLMYLLALGITTFQAAVISLVLEFNSRLLGLMFGCELIDEKRRIPTDYLPKMGKYIGKTIENMFKKMKRLPNVFTTLLYVICIIISIGSVGVSTMVCGAAGIFVSYIVCFIQVLQLCYQARQSFDKSVRSSYNLLFTIFMLMMWLLLLNSPPLIVWGKQVIESKNFEVFQDDTSKPIGIAITVLFMFILITKSSISGRSSARFISILIHIAVPWMLVYGMVHLYRITRGVIVALGLLSTTQLLAYLVRKQSPRPKME